MLRRTLGVFIFLTIAACNKSEPTPVAEVAPVPASVEVSEVVVAPPELAEALAQLQDQAPEPPTEADLAKSKDASNLVGTWDVVHTVSHTNGEASPPSKPILPTQWHIAAGGSIEIKNNNSMRLNYIYTGDDSKPRTLILTGLGPRQEYNVDALSPSSGILQLTGTIVDTPELKMTTTTLLRLSDSQ